MNKNEITYSIIIPHKNSLSLLQRCIDSIPRRDDIEIIVVDDNSSLSQKPQSQDLNVKVVSIELSESKGAGRARNYGLSHAKGKWIVFADADDYFCANFLNVLDKYKSSDYDVVYYNHNLINNGKVVERANQFINNFRASNKDSVDLLRFKINTPWNKMVRKEFIESFHINFEECIVGNDVFYSYQVGYLCRKFCVESCACYNYVINNASLTHKKKISKEHHLCSIQHRYQGREFYNFIGHPEWKKPIFRKFLSVLIRNGIFQFFNALCVFIENYSQIKKHRLDFVEKIKRKVI